MMDQSSTSMLCLPPYYIVKTKRDHSTIDPFVATHWVPMRRQLPATDSNQVPFYSNTKRNPLLSPSFKRFYIEEEVHDTDSEDSDTEDDEIETPLLTPIDEDCLSFNSQEKEKQMTPQRLRRCDYRYRQLNQWFASHCV